MRVAHTRNVGPLAVVVEVIRNTRSLRVGTEEVYRSTDALVSNSAAPGVLIIGLVLGVTGLKPEPAGRGMAVTGAVLSGVMLLGWVILAGFAFVMIASTIGLSTTYGTTY